MQYLHEDKCVPIFSRKKHFTYSEVIQILLSRQPDRVCTKQPIAVEQNASLDMFEKCITWLQYQPEASAYNTSVLISLKDMAAKKRLSSLKQTSITPYM